MLTTTTGSLFPIAPFGGYMFIGVAVGYVLQNIEPEKRNFYILSRFPIIGAIYIIIGSIFVYVIDPS